MNPKDCLFCKIVAGEIPSKKVYEDTNAFVFLDINPRNPGHMLVIPKNHYETIFDMPDNEIGGFFKIVKKMAEKCRSAVGAEGISISQSNGRIAGQMVLHMHAHIIPRFSTEGPPGLESILPVKRMDEANLDKIVTALQKNIPTASAKPSEISKPEKPAAVKTKDEEEIDFKF
jgi:histidine triad (HIT) family protein